VKSVKLEALPGPGSLAEQANDLVLAAMENDHHLVNDLVAECDDLPGLVCALVRAVIEAEERNTARLERFAGVVARMAADIDETCDQWKNGEESDDDE
jgi:hypothetical protein